MVRASLFSAHLYKEIGNICIHKQKGLKFSKLLWRRIFASPAKGLKTYSHFKCIPGKHDTLHLLPATYGLSTKGLAHGKNDKPTSSFLLMPINNAVPSNVSFHNISSTIVSPVLISWNLSVLSSKTGINVCTL